MATKWGRYVPFLFFTNLLWSFGAFFNKGSSKTPKKLFGVNPCQKLLAEKAERKKNPVFSHRLFFIAFLFFSSQAPLVSNVLGASGPESRAQTWWFFVLSFYQTPRPPGSIFCAVIWEVAPAGL
jgi:hypothetical protein